MKNLHFENIHLFKSRTTSLDENEVHQENLISKAIKKLPACTGFIVKTKYSEDITLRKVKILAA